MLGRRALVGSAIAVPISLLAPARAWSAWQRRDRPEVPFVPTPMVVVEAMLDLADLAANDRLVDLGSGDGRIVLAAARRGASGTGMEIDPELVDRARMRARLEGLEGRAAFRREDLFTAAVRDAQVVTLYLLTDVNLRLRAKLLNEMRPGARIVSHGFDMGDWEADAHRVVADANIYLWIVPAVVGGDWRITFADGRTARMTIAQRYQRASGTVDGAALARASLRGDRFDFAFAGQLYRGVVGDRTITPDPAARQAAAGWRADRI